MHEHAAFGVRYNDVRKRFIVAVVRFVSADDNAHAVQPPHLTI
jgi:hypothetical protein